MEVKLVNQTNYANIYWVFDETGRAVGIVEQRLAGRDCGLYIRSHSVKYKNSDIRKIWKQRWQEKE